MFGGVRFRIVAVALALGACASTSSGASGRVAELEARVAHLEQLVAAEGGAVRTAAKDAGSEVIDEEPRPASPPTPLGRADACMADAERICRARTLREHNEPATGDAGFSWIRIESPGAAETPEGRKCLQVEAERCRRQLQQRDRWSALCAWLDAQVDSDQLDRGLTDRARQRLAGAGQAQVEVRCTARFCRMRDPADGGGLGRGAYAVATSGSESMSCGGSTYLTQPGYRFPR